MAVAGKFGLAHYTLVTRKWKLFGNINQVSDVLAERHAYPEILYRSVYFSFKLALTSDLLLNMPYYNDVKRCLTHTLFAPSLQSSEFIVEHVII